MATSVFNHQSPENKVLRDRTRDFVQYTCILQNVTWIFMNNVETRHVVHAKKGTGDCFLINRDMGKVALHVNANPFRDPSMKKHLSQSINQVKNSCSFS